MNRHAHPPTFSLVAVGTVSALWAAVFAFVLVAALTGCVPKTEQRVLDYCRLPAIECEPHESAPPEVQAEFVEQAWCCDYVGDPPCAPVEYLSQCGPDEVAIYCQFGRSTPSSSEGGASGFECFS